MTSAIEDYSIQELVNILHMANISTLELSGERFSNLPITGARLTTGIANAINESTVNFKIDYQLFLNGAEVDKEIKVVGSLRTSVVVTYTVVNPPKPGWEEGVPQIASMATLAGHPYLRQTLAFMAGNLNFPNVTLGLVRYGSTLPESVTVGDRVYTFNPEEAQQEDEVITTQP